MQYAFLESKSNFEHFQKLSHIAEALLKLLTLKDMIT